MKRNIGPTLALMGLRQNRFSQVCLMEIMKRILTRFESVTTLVSRSLLLVATVATLCAVSVSPAQAKDLLYTTSGGGAEVFAIKVSGGKISTTDIGPTHGGNCLSLALSPSGILFSMCGPLFGNQQLATIDPKTGLANLFGVTVPGLSVMAMAFGPDGTLYAVGDCNRVGSECTSTGDPNYNSLYTVDVTTGAFTRVGSTGAPQFFMDLAFDGNGHMFGVTTTLNPSPVPAILYRIDPATGAATKIVNLVGSNSVMGLAFGREGKLYATDFAQKPGLYLIDIKTGFETAIAALPFGFSSGLELANPSLPESDGDQ